MEEPVAPQLYLVVSDPDGEALARLLDAAPVACVRLDMPASGEDDIRRAADTLRPICHDRDIALLLTGHYRLVSQTGVDGVHLMGSRDVREARKLLGTDSIVGTFVGTSRHAGMTAGEAGADYVSFGPVSDTGLGSGDVATPDLFQWWSEAIEVPVVAEGGVSPEATRQLRSFADFLAFGTEVTQAPDPVKALSAFHRILEEQGA